MQGYSYALLKQKVKMLLLAEPRDMVDDKGLFHENAIWETVENRKTRVGDKVEWSRKIGASNILDAYEIVRKACQEAIKAGLKENPDDLAQNTLKEILIDLKKETIIRVIPERAREKIKLVVDNER